MKHYMDEHGEIENMLVFRYQILLMCHGNVWFSAGLVCSFVLPLFRSWSPHLHLPSGLQQRGATKKLNSPKTASPLWAAFRHILALSHTLSHALSHTLSHGAAHGACVMPGVPALPLVA